MKDSKGRGIADDRRYEIEDFLGNRCFYVTHQPVLLGALEEVLRRLPIEILETLAHDRDLRVIFPERVANYVYRHDAITPRSSKMQSKSMWFVVLADYLNQSSHGKAVGAIAHEFAHVILEQRGFESRLSEEEEAKADDLASRWGFASEVIESKK